MDYFKHYNILMERARHRQLDCYCESHHILPICMGGEGTEEVLLLPEEHFVAHQLLVKMYPHNHKLIYAANTQGNTNNKQYGWIKRRQAELMKGNKLSVGYKHSEEFKKKMSERMKGNANPMFGKIGAMIGKPSPLGFKGKKHSLETKNKIRIAQVNRFKVS